MSVEIEFDRFSKRNQHRRKRRRHTAPPKYFPLFSRSTLALVLQSPLLQIIAMLDSDVVRASYPSVLEGENVEGSATKMVALSNPLSAEPKAWTYPDFPIPNKHLLFVLLFWNISNRFETTLLSSFQEFKINLLQYDPASLDLSLIPYALLSVPKARSKKITYMAEEMRVFEGDFNSSSRVLAPNAPRKKYRRRKDEGKSALHWGQRKLLLSEIEFLTLYGSLATLIIYAGAALGLHIKTLAEMFPNHEFHLFDPRPFSCFEAKNIKIFSGDSTGWFTDEVAQSYSESKVPLIFISDIRTADWLQMSVQEVENKIKEDNEVQRKWIEILQPKKSMLKFKCSYYPGKTEYFDGDIQLPVWGPATTTETRLIPTNNKSFRTYDNVEYGEQMFFFNTKTRMTWYPHQVSADGLCHCFDCRSEVFILSEYLSEFQRLTFESESDRNSAIATLSESISNDLGSSLSRYVHLVRTSQPSEGPLTSIEPSQKISDLEIDEKGSNPSVDLEEPSQESGTPTPVSRSGKRSLEESEIDAQPKSEGQEIGIDTESRPGKRKRFDIEE